MKWFLLTFIVLLFPVTALAQSEKQLIQEHLQLVEEGLRLKDVRHLPQSQQHARKQNLDNLRKYWQAGIFPKNTKHPNQRVPYFIDDGGRACAMAHLLIESGHKETALQIQLRENNAYVHDIQSPELATWLKTSGLTLEEAAWIQPGYPPKQDCDCPCNVAPVNDGMVNFLNECLAVRCSYRLSKDLKAGCTDPAYSVETHYYSGSSVLPLCPGELKRGYYSPGMLDTVEKLCQQPSEVTGNYDVEEQEDGCSTTSTKQPTSSWIIVLFGLFLFSRLKYRSRFAG